MNQQKFEGRFRKRSHFKHKNLLGTLLLASSIAIGGIYIGCSLQKFRSKDLTVTVKGLSEKLVSSDLAVWTLSYKNSGDDLSKLEHKTNEDKAAILAFLKAKGFADAEIEEGPTTVLDKNSREWGDGDKPVANRFILSGSVVLRTQKVDLVRQNYAKIADLIRKSVIVSGEPVYHYTKFLDLKQVMLSEASQNAVQAAKDLISSTGSKIKGVRQASQGTFTIRAKDAYGEDVGFNEQASIEKRIRVVATMTFNLQ